MTRHAVYRIACALLLTLCAAARAAEIPAYLQVREQFLPSEALLYDRQGALIGQRSFAQDAQRLEWVTLAELSPAMREALLAAEDQRFFEHSGVDWKAFVGAAWQNLWNQRKRGASTLTMQLAGLLDPALRMPPRDRRSLTQKWDQTVAARDMEARWSKTEILEAYLNLAPFRGRLQGIAAASELLFGLRADRLTRREAVILAALLRGPNAPPERVARRACQLAERLGSRNECAAIQRLTQLHLGKAQPASHSGLAQMLLKQSGQRVFTTLDGNLQGALRASLGGETRLRASVLVMDASSAEILAWASTSASDLNAFGMARTYAANAHWPHLATLALERGDHTAASLLPDFSSEADGLPEHSAIWRSLRLALASQRSAALRALQDSVGRNALSSRLESLSVAGAPAADGSPQTAATLPRLASAWRSLEDGLYVSPRLLIGDDVLSRSVASADACFITRDMLGSQPWQASTDGGGITLLGRMGKSLLLVHVDDNGQSLTGAQRLWQRTRTLLPADTATVLTEAPPGLTSNVVFFEPPVEAPRREWFLRGSEIVRSFGGIEGTRILAPRAGLTRIARNEPAWLLQASRPGRWLLDGQPIGEGQQVSWQPREGRHQLILLGRWGETLDSLQFELRITD